MISEELAASLRDTGLRWDPAPGDRFVIPQPGLSGEVFTLSEMTIEARRYPTGTILGFNGTTEWALDSVSMDEALWLPREDQLRERLGGTFVALQRVGADAGEGAPSYVVTTRSAAGEREFVAEEAADAYAYALLDLIRLAVADIPA